MSDPPVDPSVKHMVGTDGTDNLPGEKLVIMPGESLTSRADEIAELLRELRESVIDMDSRITDTDDRATTSFDRATKSELTAGRARKAAWVVAALLLVVVAFTAGLTYVALSNRANIERLDTLQRQGLCPLNTLLISSYSDAARGSYEKGPQAYDEAYEKLRQISTDVDCPAG